MYKNKTLLLNEIEKHNIVWRLNTSGYYYSVIDDNQVTLHSYEWLLHFGPIPEGYVLDHIDRNRTNNHISNLRLLTHQQNTLNRLGLDTTKSSSQYKCVYAVYSKIDNSIVSWRCRIRLKGENELEQFYFGKSFKTEIEAAKEHDRVLLTEAPDSITREHDLPGNKFGRFIPVLNFPYKDSNSMDFHTARLISISQPIPELIQELGVNSPEGLISFITRVSNKENQGSANIEKLLAYCCKNKHWSILEGISMTVEILSTKDVTSQILRHKSFSFSELSLRYTDAVPENPYEYPEFRLQHKTNRQKSIKAYDAINNGDITPEEMAQIDIKAAEAYELMDKTYKLYLELLDFGVAKECARRILPVAYSSRIFMTGNIRSFVFYIKARNSTDGKSQLEHQRVADSIEAIFKEQFPIVYSALFSN